MTLAWDPALYRRHGDHRARPFLDLVARVDATAPREVVDLGCGPGHLTPVLAQRWPDARVRPARLRRGRARGVRPPADRHAPRGRRRLLGDDASAPPDRGGPGGRLDRRDDAAARPRRGDDADWARLRAELAPRLRDAYPPDDAGVTLFGFRRVFAVLGA